jgi:hypothetical protein
MGLYADLGGILHLAFVLALALEMFGVPLSMYVITGLVGSRLPEGVLLFSSSV